MLISSNLHKKSREVSTKTKSPPASFSFKGQATKHTTVKWCTEQTTNQIECWFLVRGENRSTWGKKPLREITNKLSSHLTAGHEIEPGPHWWKASALTTAPTLLIDIPFIHRSHNHQRDVRRTQEKTSNHLLEANKMPCSGKEIRPQVAELSTDQLIPVQKQKNRIEVGKINLHFLTPVL